MSERQITSKIKKIGHFNITCESIALTYFREEM